MTKLSNKEIIATSLMLTGSNFEYDGSNLKTFQEWKKAGYTVCKGEKAFLQCQLWTPFQKKEKDSKGNEKQVTRFMLKKASLFTMEQVKPLEVRKQA